jgi:3-methyladenine DNA glycosylase AlkD
MTKNEVMTQLEQLGTEQTRKTFMRHGAEGEFFGVRIGDMKPIVRKIKKDYTLAKDLFDTGNTDAMYFAGLIADEKKMTKSDLEHWVKKAHSAMIGEYTVPWVAAETPHGWDLALEWIDSKEVHIAASGWATIASYVGITPDEDLDLRTLDKLIKRVIKEIHSAPNRVRYVMNTFLISVGASVPALTDTAVEAARKIGPVEVDMGDTSCKVPAAEDYILKIKKAGKLGKKRKTARC